MLAKKTVVFFDLITHYGGAQAGTVLLAQRLQRYYNVHVIDGYGTSEPFCRRLREAGLRTHIVQPQSSPKYFGYYDKPLIRLLRILRQAPSLWRLARDLGRLLGELGADLVWVNGAKALAVLVLSGATRHVPVVYYARGWYRREQYPSHHRWLIRRFAYDVLAVSTATRAALEEWGLPATRIHVVYNQVDFDEVLASAAMPSPSLPGLDQHPRILVPAHLMREKGQHTAVCAVGLWKRQGATFSLWLAGAQPPGARDRFEEHLRDLVREYGLQQQVHFLGWRRDVSAIMAQADIVLLPTHTEGLPRAVEEAMLLRKPVITTPVGGIGDLIIDGQTGLLVPVDDEHAVCAALARLTADPQLAQAMVARAYQRVHELLEPSRQVGRVRDAFELAMSNWPRRSWGARRLGRIAP